MPLGEAHSVAPSGTAGLEQPFRPGVTAAAAVCLAFPLTGTAIVLFAVVDPLLPDRIKRSMAGTRPPHSSGPPAGRPTTVAASLSATVNAFARSNRHSQPPDRAPLSSFRRSVMKLAAALAVAFAVALSGPALAHAHLKAATPPAGGTVAAAPTELDLTFSEGVNPRFSGVMVTGPDGKAVPTGAGALGAGGDTVLVVPVSAPLAPGAYRVDWHALATDGHKTTGSYGFTVIP